MYAVCLLQIVCTMPLSVAAHTGYPGVCMLTLSLSGAR